MSGSRHPQHPQQPTGRAHTSQTGSSAMSLTDAQRHEMQARLAYEELVSPPHPAHRQQMSPLFAHPSSPSAIGHHPAHFQTPQHSQGAAFPWAGQTAGQIPFQAAVEYPQAGRHISAHSSPGSTTSGPQSPMSAEEQGIAEDKRKRNTEASARFRMKKKERLQSMEQNMEQLQKRADGLEKEAGELRRENLWLKEIVIMKGKKRATHAQTSGSEPTTSRRADHTDEDHESDDSD